MTRVLIAALVALIVSILVGPKFIDFLRRNEFGQHIREEGPQHHLGKQGTPTMGGLMILFAATIAFLPVSEYRLQALTVLFVTLACGAIGFLDDFTKLTHQRSLGLSGRWKMLLLAGVTVVVGIVAHHLKLSTDVYVPIVGRLDPALVRRGTSSCSSSSPVRRTRRTSPTASTGSPPAPGSSRCSRSPRWRSCRTCAPGRLRTAT